MGNSTWTTCTVPPAVDAIAPDGSEIRLLGAVAGASMVHCTLAAGRVTRAIHHRTVSELWHVLSGSGQLWRKGEDAEQVVELCAGVSASIPVGVAFQFRADAAGPLTILICTAPPWPGDQEAVFVPGIWTSAEGSR
jgi:mannose-6-phosphate isomerase-like protein (cupin superfamily)